MNTEPKIYIVDDDESVCRALGRLLKSAGYCARAFNSAQSFLDSINTGACGILILDVCMPEMGGFQLQEKLNQLRSGLQVILITAHAQTGYRERAMDSGARRFLNKPFGDEELLTLIRSLTEGNQPDQGE